MEYGEHKVFTADNEEWVIARDPEDADLVYEETVGEKYRPNGEPVMWTMLPSDRVVKLDDEEEGLLSKTCAEWAKERGRGHLGSANV